MTYAIAGGRVDAEHDGLSNIMRCMQHRAVAADHDDEICARQLAFGFGINGFDRQLLKGDVIFRQRLAHDGQRMLMRFVGDDDALRGRVALLGEGGGASALRERGLFSYQVTKFE